MIGWCEDFPFILVEARWVIARRMNEDCFCDDGGALHGFRFLFLSGFGVNFTWLRDTKIVVGGGDLRVHGFGGALFGDVGEIPKGEADHLVEEGGPECAGDDEE